VNPVEFARRAAGKSPSYLVRRALHEAKRRVGSRRLRARLAGLSPEVVARELGTPSLREFWSARLARGFVLDGGDAARLRELYATRLAGERAALIDAAGRVARHEFDLLGSGPVDLGAEIDWHLDFKSGRRWPLESPHTMDYVELGRPSDVKVPWELSRGQHLPTLARAFVVDGDPRWPAAIREQILSWIAANPAGLGVNWACTMDVALRAVSWAWALGILAGGSAGAGADTATDSGGHAGIGSARSAVEALPGDFLDAALVSLYAHGLWIPEHIEFGEVNGNHYLSDAVGLVACGSLFAGTAPGDRWLDDGVAILEAEIRTQVDDDGVDIEASVPYHRLVLELFLVGLSLAERGGRRLSDGYRERLRAMLHFVDAYVTPDGLSPVIGDADDGRALVLGSGDVRDHRYLLGIGAVLFDEPAWARAAGRLWEAVPWFLGAAAVARFDGLDALATAADAVAAADAEGPGATTELRDPDGDDPEAPGGGAEPAPFAGRSFSFPDAGFHVLHPPGQYLFVDAGPVGFRGRGGHGHNDCLSFEWHAAGRPLLTDSGAYVYTASVEWRNRFRSTAFHNTVRIDGEEINRLPSELALWSLHDDARPIDVAVRRDAARSSIEAGHTGYRRLADPVTVHRRFVLEDAAPRLSIEDWIDGRREHDVEVFFHAAPGAEAVDIGAGEAALRWPDGVELRLRQVGGPDLAWERRDGCFSPSYGVMVPRFVWVATGRVAAPAVLRWELVARSRGA